MNFIEYQKARGSKWSNFELEYERRVFNLHGKCYSLSEEDREILEKLTDKYN